jgi:hypothetical protein
METDELVAWATLCVTLAGVAVTLVTVWWQLRRQWLLHSAVLITQLVDRFDSAEWHNHRRRCAELLRQHYSGEEELDLSNHFPVLPFLENLAHLTRRGALDGQMVWNKFGWIVVAYYFALTSPTNALKAIRDKESEPTNWEEFEWLYRESVRIYRRKGIPADEPSRKDLKVQQLFKWECNLTAESVVGTAGGPHPTDRADGNRKQRGSRRSSA